MILQIIDSLNHIHPIWENVFFYLFIGTTVLGGIIIFSMVKTIYCKGKENKLMQQQHTARIDIIRKENEDKVDTIRVDMLKREEERSRQWMESEKETLYVLSGVSSILDLSEKIDSSNSSKILNILSEIREKVEKLTI